MLNHLFQLEDDIYSILTKTKIQKKIQFLILDHLKIDKFKFALIGCKDHSNAITKNIITFFVQTLLYFSCNLENSERKKLSKIIDINVIQI